MCSGIRKMTKTLGAKALFATLLTLVLPITGLAQTPVKAKLDEFFDRLAEKQKAMGSFVIAKDGEIVYSRAIGYGQINGAEKTPLTTDCRFGIASITKTYTAVMILQLVEEGKLKLTDTIEKYFPQVSNAGKITIAQILMHRSGIPNVDLAERPRRDAGTRMSREEMLALIVKGTPDFEPDSRQSYSNSGYFVLTLILEKITGKSYAEALEERIISRIGLTDTYMAAEKTDVSKNESLTYWNIDNDWKPGRDTHPVIFELVSTPSDMARFIEALFDLKLISRQSLDQMKTMRDGEGLGIVTFNFAGKTFYGNTGGGDNYGSWLAYQPEEKLAISYTTNAKVYAVENIVRGAVEIYYNKPFQIPTFEVLAISPALLDRYVGDYSTPDAPAKAKITSDGSTLFFQPQGESSAVPLEATTENRFQLFGGRVVFEFNAAKGQFIVKRGGGIRVFTKHE